MNISDFALNDNQRAAVEWNTGALLVLAGPGSGKTLVLTLRAARLLNSDQSSSVLALTFTTKAADEMRERLNALMNGRADRAHLCTFHSFAGDVLRQHGSHIGIRPDFALLTLDEDRTAILDAVVAQLHNEGVDVSSVPEDRKNLLVLLDRLFADSYDGVGQAPSLSTTPPWVPTLFRKYCEVLKAANRLDYGSLLWFATRLLLENAGVSRITRLAWQYVCVDEFQDTNRSQYDLLRALVPNPPNLFVVADDDQIIYQWNGASPERLQVIRADFQMPVVQLPENFRCPPAIIDLANNLIAHNKSRTAGKQALIARKPATDAPCLTVSLFDNEAEELSSVAHEIRNSGWDPEDCAVLARATKLLERCAVELSQVGLLPHLAQRKNEFQSAAVRWVYAALRLANARHDREFLRRLCVAWEGFSSTLLEVSRIEAAASLEGGDFLRAWVKEAMAACSNASLQELLLRVQQDLVSRLTFVALIEWFWSRSWEDPLEKEEIATWKELHGALLREHSLENITLHLYLQEMDLKSKAPPKQAGSVSCLTVHGAKGLEFKHVFLVGMADEVFPSYQAVKRGPDSKEMEEERRNCFVAITRVQETLRISWARTYSGYPKRPSRFIEEMGFRFRS